MVRTCFFLLLLAISFRGFSQVEGTLHFMKVLPQVVNNNPAFRPLYKGHIGLPGSSVFVAYTNNGFTYNDLISSQNGVNTADLGKLYAALEDENYITQSFQADLFRLGFQLSPKFYLMGHVTAKTHAQIKLPKDVFGLFVNGTTPFINDAASLNAEVNGLGYVESALGASLALSKKLRLGFRAKYLQGVATINTVRSDGSLSVDENLNITAKANLQVNTAGINSLTSGNPDFAQLLKNSGFGFDAGVTIEPLRGLVIGASILDLGSISWKNDLRQYALDSAKAKYTFQGLDLNRILNNTSDGYLDEQLDSLKANFELEESTLAGFQTTLPTRLLLSGEWELIRNFSIGGLLIFQNYKERINPTLVVSATKNFGRLLTTSFSYTMSNNSWNNLGAGLSLNLSPLQIYVVGDNLLRVPLALASDGNVNRVINSAQFFNLRVGLNFTWGRIKEEENKPNNSPTGGSKRPPPAKKRRR